MTSKWLAFCETLVIGLAYKVGEKNPGNLGTSMMENTLGAGAATLTLWDI